MLQTTDSSVLLRREAVYKEPQTSCNVGSDGPLRAVELSEEAVEDEAILRCRLGSDGSVLGEVTEQKPLPGRPASRPCLLPTEGFSASFQSRDEVTRLLEQF